MRSLTSEGSLDKSLRFWAPADLWVLRPSHPANPGRERLGPHPAPGTSWTISPRRQPPAAPFHCAVAGAGLGAPLLGAPARPVMVAGGTGTCAKSGISSAAWAARLRRARDSHITGRDLATW